MSWRWAAISTYQLKCFVSRFCRFKSSKFSHFFSNYSSIGSSSTEDNLQGLIEPEICNSKEDLASVSISDFTFLNEVVVETKSKAVAVDASLIAEAIQVAGNVFDESTEKFLRQFRSKLNENLVADVLKLVKLPELAVKFFIWAGRQIGYTHSARSFDSLIEVLGFEKQMRISQQFLREIQDDDREVLGRLLNVLVRKCCKCGLWNQALEELGRLKDFGYKPSKVTYNALVQVLLSADRLDSAFLVYREMSSLGITMDRLTMGCFAFALCKVGRWVEAVNIVEKDDFTLDTVLCTQMIRGLLEASLYEEAMSFLHRMRANSCVPNVVTYRTLLSGFLRKGQLGWCKRIINMMMKEGCCPNYQLFNSLIHAYCVSGDYAYAFKLLKKMAYCGSQPTYVTYNILIGGICGKEELPSSEAMGLAEETYEELLGVGLVLNKVNVANFTRCLCAMGKYSKALVVIKEMMRRGFIPDASTYTKVITFLLEAYKVEDAFHLFHEMISTGVTADVYTYTILIDNFCKIGLIEQARTWFSEMIMQGCTPNVVTYTALIHGYLKSKRIIEANELFEKMLNQKCLPNIVTYTALIDGLCKAGQVEMACQVYSRMKGSFEDTDAKMYFQSDCSSSEATEPNVFTYGALVDGLCKSHKVLEACNLLEAMSSAGCEPNPVVYDALIDGFCKVDKLDDAQEIFLRMTKRGYSPNVYTYSSLIDKMFKDKRLDLALKVLSKMLENSCPPNVITYTEMIDGLCKFGKTDEAYKLFKMMETKGCKPNVVTYTAMIDGFGKAEKINMCLELVKLMMSKGCAPNFITYRVLIDHCCAFGLLDEALNFLEEMKQTYWPVSGNSYQNVIQGFSKKFISSLGLLDELSNYSSVPIAPAYSMLIHSFSQAGRVETALELYKEIVAKSTSAIISKRTYTSLIVALSLAYKVEHAFELYSEMTRRGHIPELFVLSCLIKGLFQMNKWDVALELLYSTCFMGILWHGQEVFDGG